MSRQQQADGYRCEAYVILYSFRQSDDSMEAFAQGTRPELEAANGYRNGKSKR